MCVKEWETGTRLGLSHFLPDIPSLPNCNTEFSDDSMLQFTDDGSGKYGM